MRRELQPRAAGAQYPHKPLQDEDVIELGNVRMRVVHTPGHTPESVTLLVSDRTRAEEPWLALTGDTLISPAARTPGCKVY